MKVDKRDITLPSAYQIGDTVKYNRTVWKNGGEEIVESFGTVTAVRFTKAKVEYTISDDFSGYTESANSDDIIYESDTLVEKVAA